MIVYKDYTDYDVIGTNVSIISDEIGNGQNTVAEIANSYYYLGNETPNVLAAIVAWEELNGRDLTQDELDLVMKTNIAISVAY